jgi:carbamoyl-phosphate synthase large subunit
MDVKVLIKEAGNKVNLVKEFQKWGAFVIADDDNMYSPACMVANDVVTGRIGNTADIVLNWPKHPLCSDKAEFYRFCRRHEFPVPATGQFKAIVKPRFGKGSRGTFVIDRSYIVQEFVDWPEYSIDYFADYEGNPLSIIPRKRLNVVDGESKAASIDFDPFLIEQAFRMGTELDIRGPACMQLFYNGTDILWIEVNPRYGGGTHFTWHIFSGPKWQIDYVRKVKGNQVQEV